MVDAMLVLLVVLFGVSVVMRFANAAAAKSNREELKREVIRAYLRRKRIDELYGRDEDEDR